MKRKSRTDLRIHPLRRQLNEAFCGPDGEFSVSKFLAAWSQIAVLAHMNVWFDKLLDKPEALLIVLSFLIGPDLFKKLLTLKLVGTEK